MLEQLEKILIQTKGYNNWNCSYWIHYCSSAHALSQRRAIHQSTADPAIYAHCHLHYQRSTRSLSAKLRYHLRTFTSSHFPLTCVCGRYCKRKQRTLQYGVQIKLSQWVFYFRLCAVLPEVWEVARVDGKEPVSIVSPFCVLVRLKIVSEFYISHKKVRGFFTWNKSMVVQT